MSQPPPAHCPSHLRFFHLFKVYEGIELCRKKNVDFILAVGGGSVIDSAKAIVYGLSYEGDVWDLFEGKAMAEKCYPVEAVLTIPAAGSEMSCGCVITNENGFMTMTSPVQSLR